MAATAAPTIADIQAKAQELAAAIATNPVNATDKKQIVTHAKNLLTLVQAAQPHINTAATAGFDVTQAQNDATALTNRLQKVIAAYS